MTDRTKPALALSGGGFRATLYHLGALIRLNELGLLTTIERVSSVSGGSITAGVLAKAWQNLSVKNGIITNFDANITKPVREFCKLSIDTKAVLLGAINPLKSIGDVLAGIYDDKLFGGRGDDVLKGGWGDDLLVGGPGKDKLDGGSGGDRLIDRDACRPSKDACGSKSWVKEFVASRR